MARGSKARIPPGNLPADASTFIGRRRELAEVKRLLARSRLVTLTGVGGVGKTRLALRVAAELRRSFPDGVWFVDLTRLSDATLLPRCVAEVLRIRDHSPRSALSVLIDHLRDRQQLLVLDNCEHLLEPCAVLVDRILAAAPRVRIVVTSRQALSIRAEQILQVPPMSLPDAAQPAPPIPALSQFEAVTLFSERAAAALSEFRLTEQNSDAVVKICRDLDGIPLAIELAAVRLRVLSPQELAARLGDRFRLLTGARKAATPRHETLRALIDWSFEMCSPAERLFWARASLFAGTLDLTAAEEVCSADGIDREDVVELISALIDKSVLVKENHQRTVRYRMLETIRQYGRERLVEYGEWDTLHCRHRDYYRRLAARANEHRFAPDQVRWFARLEHEHPDLRAALAFCRIGSPETGLGLATDLLYHWITSYYHGEGRSWLDAMLALATEPSRERAAALWTNSWLAIIQGDLPAAKSMLAEARILGEELGDESALGYAALFSGFVAMYGGDADTAVGLYDEALRRHRAIGNRHGEALTLIRKSMALSYLGDAQGSIALAEQCLAVCDGSGDIWHKSYALIALGIEVWRQGDTHRAAALERESLGYNQSLNDLLGIALNLEVLAWIAASEGEFERAGRLLGSLRTVWRSVGSPLSGYGHLTGYHDECECRTREALGDAGYQAAAERGARASLEQAVAYAAQRTGGSRAAAPEHAAGVSSPLTPRERQTAALIARGLSNREIAKTLVVSQRTAEAHVEHILSKLGFGSRAQIAAWAVEHLPDGEPR
ncbi:ATP-binding protein [Gandjariella thermophila]|uniref:LuxR family transcriptional regulator n=1 Tax=Gandjariella thermophila TaxID=1931992 RepID=A0A4D4J3R8_9PSEU|nr:LuxR C-terminal-related transcriptional regulator [Gandjariella thermophila]GDY29722.1 LuxR family transcriptional regulator [Gandjariella thermophila]